MVATCELRESIREISSRSASLRGGSGLGPPLALRGINHHLAEVFEQTVSQISACISFTTFSQPAGH